MITCQNILVPTDFSEASESALLYGRTLARLLDARLHVLHVVNELLSVTSTLPPTYVPAMDEAQRDLERRAREQVNDLVRESDEGNPNVTTCVAVSPSSASAILAYAEANDIDLIIIGSHGRGGFVRLLLGSVAEQVVRAAPCPVLTVRSRERDFVRPDALEVAEPVHPS